MIRTTSHNRKILNNLLRKGRRKSLPSYIRYFILYAFLYKYLSDKLKNHLMYCLAGDEADLNMFYLTDEGTNDLKQWAFDDLGYFFESRSAYIDSFISSNFVEDIFTPDFFKVLKDNIVFADNNPAEEYFRKIIEIMERQIGFYKMNFDEELNLFMSNYLFSLSKFDITENEFTYAQVYDAIASSRQLRIQTTPEYISNIITSIVKSQRNHVANAYDPFMGDASTLFDLYKDMSVPNISGKEDNELYYCYSLIKAFINEIDIHDISLYNENAIKSMSVDLQLFDVIVSKIPNRFNEFSKSRLKRQSLEMPGEDKSNEFKKALLSNFDFEKLSGDDEALKALKVLEDKFNEMEKADVLSFKGEYESLADSEFLFLINMINCLKDDGLMVVSLSQNFLFKQSLETLRKFLTYENNYIDAIISLPEGLERAIRPEVIIVFKKNRTKDDIVFIDLSQKYGTEISRNAVPGLFRRNMVLDDATISRIIDVLNNRRPQDQFCEIVTLRDLEENEFNLTVSRYVDTYDGDFIRLNSLKKEKEEIDKRMDELNIKIDVLIEKLNLKK